MKSYQTLASFWICLLLLTGCQRELSFENVTGAASSGTLKSSATGDCLPSTLNGIYKAGVQVSADNYINVDVNVTKTGTYTIATDTLNGIVFSSTGSFNTTGVNTVRLQAFGKPLSAATTIFSIRYGAVSCTISVVTISANTASAVFAYKTETDGLCSGAVLAGVYKTNTTTDASNSVKLSVNVTTAGAYNVSTPAVNGITFSATGVFTATGA